KSHDFSLANALLNYLRCAGCPHHCGPVAMVGMGWMGNLVAGPESAPRHRIACPGAAHSNIPVPFVRVAGTAKRSNLVISTSSNSAVLRYLFPGRAKKICGRKGSENQGCQGK